MIVPLEPSDKPTSQRRIAEGDTVVVYERHDAMRAGAVRVGGVLQNRFGVFRHDDWIGRPFGSKVYSSAGGGGGGGKGGKGGGGNAGGFVYLLAPTPELWTMVLSHRTQILYIADISLVVAYLELVPGCVVLESGTGSGSLTTSLARAVAPHGHVHTFDFHEQRAASAREDFERNGLSGLITVNVRDIQGEGFPEEHRGAADAVFLDLPQPWLAIPSVGLMLKQDGVLCSFSPCIEQVQRACKAMRSCFTDIRTFEILLRTYEVRDGSFKSASANEDTVGPLPQKRKKNCHSRRKLGLYSDEFLCFG
uniref:tRNA (adenine(58)-N(1))-methyltransferase n=1 Tax=Arundo donax TaxID=35708 RepID=A0A0A9D5Q4_ARUDO